MAEQVNATNSISMALDMKRNRIRIHKPAIHMLGDPTLIQLLFDPEDMEVAIVCPESEVPGGQEVRINPRGLKSRNCLMPNTSAVRFTFTGMCFLLFLAPK